MKKCQSVTKGGVSKKSGFLRALRSLKNLHNNLSNNSEQWNDMVDLQQDLIQEE